MMEKKADITTLTRNVSRGSESSPASTEPSVASVEEIDQGISGNPLAEYTNPDGEIETPKRVQSYSGVTDIQQTECSECSGSGSSCTECSGSGYINCNKCSGGTISHQCGCWTREKHQGDNRTVRAGKGEVIQICKTCGGDGYRGSYNDSIKCDACDRKGAFVETCKNCGGDGISSREQCVRCDGRGKYTCENCDGSGDVDVCQTCEGEGELIEQQVAEVVYELNSREQLIDADDPVNEHRDEIAWVQTETESITDDFTQLPVTADDRENSETVAAKVEYFKPVLYSAEIELSHPTIGDEGESQKTVSALVSDDVIKNDGRFAAREHEGKLGQYLLGVPYEILRTFGEGIAVGLAGTAVISFIWAIFIDLGLIGNPVSSINHPFPSDISGLFFIIAGVLAAAYSVMFLSHNIKKATSKYTFRLVGEG